MKHFLFLLFWVIPLFARNTFWGDRGIFKTYSALTEEPGFLTISPLHFEWYTETPSGTPVNHYHHFRYHGGIGFAPVNYFEFSVFGDLTGSYADRVDIPVDRDNVGYLDCDNNGLSLKFGYPFYLAPDSNRFIAAGVQTFLSMTSNKPWYFYEQLNDSVYYYSTGRIGFVPRSPEIGFRGLFDYGLRLVSFHANLGIQTAGKYDFTYAPWARGWVRRNPQLLFGVSAEYAPIPYVIFVAELAGNYRFGPNNLEYVWLTPGVRFCTRPKTGVNFDLGCELGLTDAAPAWNLLFGLSVETDIIP